jgi:hypothetical protein
MHARRCLRSAALVAAAVMLAACGRGADTGATSNSTAPGGTDMAAGVSGSGTNDATGRAQAGQPGVGLNGGLGTGGMGASGSGLTGSFPAGSTPTSATGGIATQGSKNTSPGNGVGTR